MYEEVWGKGDCIVVLNVPPVRSALLWDYHDSPFAGPWRQQNPTQPAKVILVARYAQ